MEKNIEYYIDTSVLKSSIVKIHKSSFKYNFCISGLNLLELFSQINIDSYNKIRSNLININKSYVKIDWRLPEDIIAKSYGLKIFIQRTKWLKKIYNSVLGSSDHSKFINNVEKKHLRYIYNYDKIFEETNDELKSEEIKNVVKIFNSIKTQSNIKENYSEFLKQDSALRQFTISNFKNILHLIIGPLTNTKVGIESANTLIKNYNRKIDVFIYFYTLYKLDKYSKKEFSGRNDFIDLLHITYLENKIGKRKFIYADKIYKRFDENVSDIFISSDKIL